MLDVRFPTRDEPDGVECIAEMRRRGYEGIACMMTGDASPTTLLRAALAGANCYYVKGCEKRFRRSVEELLAGSPKYAITLYSLGLSKGEVALMLKFREHGYPRIKTLSNNTGTEAKILRKRFQRIRDKLGLESQPALAVLMKAIAAYGLLEIEE